MKRNQLRTRYSVLNTRHAHSLIELLVVLIIVGMLIAIIVPAVQRSREAARMAQCIHNQGQLAKAVHLHLADEPYGRFPGYRAFGADGTPQVGWAPQVFEYLGRRDLDPAQATYVEVLVCPSNQGPTDSPRLNYVVNGGQSGTDSPADGVFFDHAKPMAQRAYITKDDFRDGLTNTILLAENLDATQWNVTDETNQCILWPLAVGNEINQGVGARPSSHHPDGFVAAFADGSVKFMAETEINDDANIGTAGSRYAALLTPGGDDADVTGIPGPNDPPCYDSTVGFPEVADLWMRSLGGCAMTFGHYRSLNPDNNPWVLLMEDTPTQYRLIYSGDWESWGTQWQMGNDMELMIRRESDGSVTIQPMWHTTGEILTVYDGDPNDGGQPIPGLINMGGDGTGDPESGFASASNLPYSSINVYAGCNPSVIDNPVPGAQGTLPAILCNP